MGNSSPLPEGCAPPTRGDTYEKVRLSFSARLNSDAARLATLATALANARHHPTAVFSDIREFAHRLRGAAAVFEELPLSAAAKALEQVAMDAAAGNANRRDPGIAAAMRALAVQLALAADCPASGRRGDSNPD